jgi:hypothetical protein
MSGFWFSSQKVVARAPAKSWHGAHASEKQSKPRDIQLEQHTALSAHDQRPRLDGDITLVGAGIRI